MSVATLGAGGRASIVEELTSSPEFALIVGTSSMREVAAGWKMGGQTRQGAARWYASTIHGLLASQPNMDIGPRVLRPGSLRPGSSPARGPIQGPLGLRSPRPTQRILVSSQEGSRSRFRLWSIRACCGRSRARDKTSAQATETPPLGVCMGWPYAVAVCSPIAGKASSLAEGAFEETALLSMQCSEGDRLAARRRAIARCAPTSSKRLSWGR